MPPLELALAYLNRFYNNNLRGLEDLLAPECTFRGPLFTFDSAQAYIESLRADPPRNMRYDILHTFENAASACVIYRFTKPGVQTQMAQVFEAEGGVISAITLIFDSGAFTA